MAEIIGKYLDADYLQYWADIIPDWFYFGLLYAGFAWLIGFGIYSLVSQMRG